MSTSSLRSSYFAILVTATMLLSGCIRERVEQIMQLPPRRPSPEKILSLPVQPHSGRWVLINERLDSLSVKEGEQTLVEFHNVAFGVAGVGIKRRQGDGITPQGSFRIHEIRPSSRFHIFAALDYPTEPYIELGRKYRVIGHYEMHQFLDRINRGLLAPQTSPLGGNIGIHGVGRGSLDTHESVNWTDGCIAVRNEEIEQLASLVGHGTPVEITKGL